MVEFGVRKGEAVYLSLDDEILVMGYIRDIVVENGLKVVETNICGDHLHLLLVCGWGERDGIVGKLKSISSRRFNISKGWTIPEAQWAQQGGMPPCSPVGGRGFTQTSLWAQKYHYREIKNDRYLSNVTEYIRLNRYKHYLPPSSELEKIIESMLTPIDEAFG